MYYRLRRRKGQGRDNMELTQGMKDYLEKSTEEKIMMEEDSFRFFLETRLALGEVAFTQRWKLTGSLEGLTQQEAADFIKSIENASWYFVSTSQMIKLKDLEVEIEDNGNISAYSFNIVEVEN